MRVELLELIRNELNRWPDLGLASIGWYRAQHLKEEQEEAFPELPACLLQIDPEIIWRTHPQGVIESEPFRFTLHIFQHLVVNSEETWTERYDTMEYVRTVLASYGARGEDIDYFTPFEFVQAVEDDNFDQLTHDQLIFETAYSDYRPKLLREGERANLSGLNVSQSLDQ